MRGIKLGIIIGQLDTGNNQVILLIRGMCAENQTVYAKILPFRSVKQMTSVLIYTVIKMHIVQLMKQSLSTLYSLPANLINWFKINNENNWHICLINCISHVTLQQWIKQFSSTELNSKIVGFIPISKPMSVTLGVNVLPGDIWQPLSSKTGPLQRVGHHQIVKKRGVFLPYFIFFIYHPLLHRVIKCSCNKKGRENKMRSVKTTSTDTFFIFI